LILFFFACKGGKKIGGLCNDGWRIFDTGRGVCGDHGGAAYWTYD